jgi:hypothetical protein
MDKYRYSFIKTICNEAIKTQIYVKITNPIMMNNIRIIKYRDPKIMKRVLNE